MTQRNFVVAIEEGVIAGARVGEGASALLLHGGPGLRDYTRPLAAELASNVSVIRYQQRGVEPSVAPGPYTLETHADDAVALLDHFEIAAATVIGHSWGGLLALFLACTRPDRIGRLILIGTPGVDEGDWEEFEHHFTERIPEDVLSVLESLDDGSEEDLRKAWELIWPYYFPDASLAPAVEENASDPTVFADGKASFQEHVATGTFDRGLPTFEAPTLLIHGDGDPVPAEQSRRTAEKIGRAELRIVAAGHFPWLESPGLVGSTVAQWLSRPTVEST